MEREGKTGVISVRREGEREREREKRRDGERDEERLSERERERDREITNHNTQYCVSGHKYHTQQHSILRIW